MRYIWSFPNTLIGLLLCLVYLPRKAAWFDGCLEMEPRWMIGQPHGQTWGWLIFFKNDRRRNSQALRVHERIHVSQGFKWGPMFLVMYAAHWLYLWPKHGFKWYPAYREVWAEKEAYRAMKIYPPGAWGTKQPGEY